MSYLVLDFRVLVVKLSEVVHRAGVGGLDGYVRAAGGIVLRNCHRSVVAGGFHGEYHSGGVLVFRGLANFALRCVLDGEAGDDRLSFVLL